MDSAKLLLYTNECDCKVSQLFTLSKYVLSYLFLKLLQVFCPYSTGTWLLTETRSFPAANSQLNPMDHLSKTECKALRLSVLVSN